MKSASGRQTPPPGYELTCVEPGRKGYAAVIRVGSTTPTDSASRCRAKPIFPQTHGCLASGLSHGRIWRAGIRPYGTAEHPAALSDVRHHRYRHDARRVRVRPLRGRILRACPTRPQKDQSWSGSVPRGGIARSDSSGSSMGNGLFYSLVLPSTKAVRAVRSLLLPGHRSPHRSRS